ncbi:MAG: thioredoxin family protein [Bacteroidetes bacterium]|nr:MAG: thioredoxin family protein [Bacteroidota bacterium]
MKLERSLVRDAFTYEEYRQLHKDMVDQGRTSGPNQTESLIFFTKLNAKRSDRLDKHHQLSEETLALLKGKRPKIYWLVLSEVWCADSAQILPIMAKIVEQAKFLSMGLLLRDDYPEVMEQFLSDGTNSIPKLIAFDEAGEALYTWGPRPSGAQAIVDQWKAEGKTRPKDEVMEEVQHWYIADKGQSIETELRALLAQ